MELLLNPYVKLNINLHTGSTLINTINYVLKKII